MAGIEQAVAKSGTFAIGGEMRVHRMGFGAMRLTGPRIWGEPADPAGALAVLRRAVELGIDFIDTAEAYGPHVNELQIAEALSPYRAELIVATKCGLVREWPVGIDAPTSVPDGRPEGIRSSIEGSLKRLRLATIDLYQLHRIDPNVPLADQIGALDRLRREGKVRHIGLSEVSVEQLEAARAITPIATVQNAHNLIYRKHEAVLAACEAAGIGFMPWSPIGGGRTDLGKRPAIAAAAAKHGATPTQIALAWLLACSPVMLPIPGTGSIKHLEENIGAALIELDADDMAALDAIEARR